MPATMPVKESLISPANWLYRTMSNCCHCSIGKTYSTVSIKWLDSLIRQTRRVIQHAGNIGEYKIPGTNYKVDGFNKRSNTVYEFLGDYWHRQHQSKQDTMKRLRKIKRLGYTVIYIWESDYLAGKSAKQL